MLLEQEGYQVRTFSDGAAALKREIVKKQAEAEAAAEPKAA